MQPSLYSIHHTRPCQTLLLLLVTMTPPLPLKTIQLVMMTCLESLSLLGDNDFEGRLVQFCLRRHHTSSCATTQAVQKAMCDDIIIINKQNKPVEKVSTI